MSESGNLVPYIITQPQLPAQRGYSFLDVLAYKWDAWTTRQVADATICKITAEKEVFEARVDYTVAQLNARELVAIATGSAEEAEAELAFGRAVRSLPAAEARAYLSSETEIERRLGVRAAYRTARQTGATQHLLPPGPAAPVPAAQVAIDVSDQQIEAEALRGVARLGALPPAEVREAYLAWQEDLKTRLPEYAYDEVLNRTDSKLKLIQSGH